MPYSENITQKQYFDFRNNTNYNPKDFKKIYCPYYHKNEICHAAYYYSYNLEDTFKEPYSCCNCSHRILTSEGDSICPYGWLDQEERKMYYLEPRIKTKENTVIIKARYWTCPICKTVHEISLKEYEYKPK